MKITIFYSWQSDLPNNTNRGFIESVISKAINDIKRQETYELDICLERDTQGTPGSPNIVKTILDRVSKCDIFIADISIVTGDLTKMQRLSPNPNVLIELGYAISCVGWDRIILFCNEIYGTNEKLPFDIQQHRRIGYKLRSDDIKAPIRDQLAKILKDGLIEKSEISPKGKITYGADSAGTLLLKFSRAVISRMTKWHEDLVKMRMELNDNRKNLEELNGFTRIFKINEFLLDAIARYKIFITNVDKILEA